MKELTSRQQQAIATKKRIRETAYMLLQDQSFEQLKMSDIASSAGVSVGTLYHHYASKEELFFDGYHDFDLMVEQLHGSISFYSHVEAIRAMIYAQAGGSILRSVNLMSTALRIQLSSQGNLFLNHERYFPQYIFHHVKEAVAAGELLPIDSADEIAKTILRSARGSIFDCCARNAIEQITQIAIHDLDIILSHYIPDHRRDFPPVNPAWLEAYRQWLARQSENND